MSKDRITFKCAKCGSLKFEMPKAPRPTDTVTCLGCGARGTHAQVMAAAQKLATDELKKLLKKAGFK